MGRHLVTTSLQETWPQYQPLLLLSEACMRFDQKAQWEDANIEYASFQWSSTKEIEAAILYCDAVFEELLGSLTTTLNSIHDEQHDTEYYLRLLGPWLRSFIDQLYDKYRSVKRATDEYPSLNCSVLPISQYVVPSDFKTYLLWISDEDRYAFQLYSDVTRFLTIPSSETALANPLHQETEYHYVSSRLERYNRMVSLLLHPTRFFAKSTPQAYLVQAGLRVKDIRSRLALRRRLPRDIVFDDFQYRCSATIRIDNSLRRKRPLGLASDPFRTLLSEITMQHIPALYLESYQEYRTSVLARCGQAPKLFFSANSLTTNSVFRFFSAEHHTRSKLLYMQHGGAYGTEKIHTWEDLEKRTADIYLNYGWEQKGNSRSLPHPRFSPPLTTTPVPQCPARVVFLCNSFSRYVFRFQFKPLSNAVVTSYLKTTQDFLLRIPQDTPLFLRFYPGNDFGWRIRERTRAAGITFKESMLGSLDEEILASDLIVIDHLGTSYLECLAKNRPTIILSSQDYFASRSEATPYFDALEQCGILHFDQQSAAEHFERVSTQLADWWNSSAVQTARQAFVARFASFDSKWATLWADEIGKELAVNPSPNNEIESCSDNDGVCIQENKTLQQRRGNQSQ